MFCRKCGKQLPDGAKFCTGCGENLSDVSGGAVDSAPSASPNAGAYDYNPETPEGNDDGGNKKTLFVILMVILAVVILAVAGLGVYFFKTYSDNKTSVASYEDDDEDDDDDEDEDEDEDEEDNKKDDDKDKEDENEDVEAAPAAAEEPVPAPDTVAAAEEPEEDEPLSTTNEVVRGEILWNIPIATYAYDFDGDLGNAILVERADGSTMPTETDASKAKFISGMDGEAISLDGNYGIQLPDISSLGSNFTISFWMCADTEIYDWVPFLNIGHDLLDNNARYRLYLAQKTDGKTLSPILSSEDVKKNNYYEIKPTKNITKLDSGIWYMVTFTVSGKSNSSTYKGTLYVAGQEVGSGNIAADTFDAADLSVFLGIDPWNLPFEASYDDVLIWDQVLSAYQIADLEAAYY